MRGEERYMLMLAEANGLWHCHNPCEVWFIMSLMQREGDRGRHTKWHCSCCGWEETWAHWGHFGGGWRACRSVSKWSSHHAWWTCGVYHPVYNILIFTTSVSLWASSQPSWCIVFYLFLPYNQGIVQGPWFRQLHSWTCIVLWFIVCLLL